MRAVALAIAAAAALLLAGCPSFQNPLNETRLTAIEAAWAGALAGFNGYKDLCADRIIPVSCRTVVPIVQRSANTAQAAVLAARAAMSPTARLNAAQAIDAAARALSAFTAAKAQYGVQ